MKNLKKRWKRAAAIGLAAIMLTAQLPVTAFAEEAVKQETTAEPVITQEMTAAAETPEQTEDKTASEAPEQTESEAVSGTPEEPGDKKGDEAPVGTTGPVEQSNPTEAAKDGSEDETEKQDVQEADKTEAASDGDKEKEEDKASEEKKTPAFKESRSVVGVRITVEAEEGVFPEGAVLSVEKVTAAEERKAEEAVEDKRPEEQNVAASYTYDIKVLDKDGNEIQPADETKVKVSFTLEEVADANLTTNVYHIVEEDSQNGGDSGEAAPKEGDNLKNSRNEEADAGSGAELTAEKLEVETDGDTAIVETDGFSLYTVEFTYDSKQYVLPGDSEVALSDILEAVGLSGEASAVEVSKSSLFSAEKNEGGEWIVTAHKAFGTKEWMKVIIDGVEYEITVTDDQEAGSWAELQAQFNSASTDENNPTQITLTGNVTAGEGDTALVIPAGKYVTLNLNGHTIDRGLAGQPVGNNGNVITVSGNLTLTDNSSTHTGTITGGNNGQAFGGGVSVKGGTFTMDGGTISGCNAARGGGVNVDSGTFTMTGGTITGCNAYDAGGGVCVNGSFTMNGGTFTMTGGTITDCNATSHGGRGGGVYVEGGCKFTMDGGTITDCNATSSDGRGGGVYNHGTFNMSDGTITNCSATGDESNGGGVYIEDRGTFKVSGTPVISGNMKGSTSANNVELGGKTISVNGALTSGAEIHVNAGLGVPIAEKGGDRTTALTETEAGYFKSDVDSNLLGGLNDAGQVVLKDPLPALTGAANLTYNGTEQTPALTFESATLEKGTDYTVSYKKVDGSTETEISGSPKDAGDYKAVVTGTGSYAGIFEAVFTIARKEVTVSSGIAAKDKTYDRTTDAELITTNAVFTGICDGDSLTVSGTGSFEDASAGTNKTVKIDQSSLTLGGTSSGNYVLAGSGNQTTATANITKATPTITSEPKAKEITYGQTLENSDLNGGEVIVNGSSVQGSFAWDVPKTAPAVSDSNKTEYTVIFTPNDTMNFNQTTCKVKLTVNKADITADQITPPAKIEDLEYTGQALSLISAGSVSGNIGTMQYVLGTDVECPVDFTPAIPSATNAGIYHVWYKVKGDDNHNDTAVSGPVAVVIAKADFTDNTVSGNTKYGLAGKVELKDCIAPGGELGTMTVSDPDAVLEGEPSLSGTVLSYKFVNDSANVDKAARVTVSVNNATNHKDYEIVATLNVINCDHAHTELQGVKAGNCTEEGYSGNLVCTECGSIIEYGHPTAKVPDAHDFDEGRRTKEPTTITKGETTYRCRRCGYEKIEQDIPCKEEEGKNYDDLRKDLEGLSENAAPKVETKNDEKGNEVTTVSINGAEVEQVVKDPESGKETVKSLVWVGGLKESYRYTGAAIKPEFHVYDGTNKLTEKTDYTVSFKKNKDVGTGEITVKFKGNYGDTKPRTLNFEIKPAILGEDIIAHETGVTVKKSAQKPVPVLTWASTGKTVAAKNFNIIYDPAVVKDAGTYTATITPKKEGGNFDGRTTALVKVAARDKVLSNVKVRFDPASYPYNGKPVEPKYTLTMGTTTLTEGTDFECVSLTGNINPGTAVITFEAISGNEAGYVGSKTATFKITGKKSLKDAAILVTCDESAPFAKGGAKAAVTVIDKDTDATLKEGLDYTLSYSKNKFVDKTAEVKVKGKGNYRDSVTKTFTVTKQSLKSISENIIVPDQFTTRSNLKAPKVTITDSDGKKLSSGKDYSVGDPDLSAEGNTEDSGVVYITITGKGNYSETETDSVKVSFRYTKDTASNISKARTKAMANQPYTGNAVKLSKSDLTEKVYTGSRGSENYLKPGTDFEVIESTYTNNVKKGTARVTVRGLDKYAGTKTLSFKIVQKGADYQGALIGDGWIK